MILSFFDPLRNPLSFFDLLRDPLKDCAVVPQKYVEMMERQGWVKPIRCKNCWKLGYDNCPMDDYFDSHPTEPDFFCAAGEPEEMRPRSTCGPDYCEIGGDEE